MKIKNMNKGYLDAVLRGETVDYLYHFGLCSTDECFQKMKDIKAVVMAGSPDRVQRMAETWNKKHKKDLLFKFPKDERFSAFYTGDILFCSHGMGMPSISIALQELMKLVYFVKDGNLEEIDKVMWFRIGTSGGLVAPGSVVITTEALRANFKPYRLLVTGEEYSFESNCPEAFINKIIHSNKNTKFDVVKGKTIGADSFYIEQNRIDGAIALCDEQGKMEWLKKAEKIGVKNIEMESPNMVGFLNHWGFSHFAVICSVIVNRLKGDQVSCTKEELEQLSMNAETVLWNFLESK